MNLLGTYRATRSENFRARVLAAMLLTAIDIQNDDALAAGHPRHLASLEVVLNPEGNQHITRFLWYVAANPAIASSVMENGEVGATDNDVHYVVSSAWYTMFPDAAATAPEVAAG